ncbi:hypothetical protein N7517_008588 [Penicillium concentricum]|uniref:Uncharacterized protein n=1 Tax=Penicillium concentricum TaxID=293559 RepID=A0A9W9RT00_9EURO|nr:uncharacterized protein N7517_008588 [Penicillium concentricum]KAJ5365702.1 hypothetical protein N7517_008588 [Penicillium concentricum]
MDSSLFSVEGLDGAFSADFLSLGLSAVGLGVISHVSIFRTLPVEEYLYGLLGLYIVSLCLITLAYISVTNLALLQVLIRVGWIAFTFNVALTSSIGIYRLFFHRLHHFPGPVLSKLSRFYDAYLAGKNVQYNMEIEKLHDTYGDFIRTGRSDIIDRGRSALFGNPPYR